MNLEIIAAVWEAECTGERLPQDAYPAETEGISYNKTKGGWMVTTEGLQALYRHRGISC